VSTMTLLDDCLRQVRRQGVTLGVFSLGANLLLLVSSIYMLQVFDRVLSSASLDTLLWLTVAAVLATAIYGVLEFARRRLLALSGEWVETQLAGPVIRAGIDARLAGQKGDASLADVRDLRAFLGGDAILAFLDAPFMPIFILVIWLMHPLLGWVALGGAVALFALALVNDRVTRRRQETAGGAQRRSQAAAQQYLEQAETVRALGMLGPVLRRWQGQQQAIGDLARPAAAVTDGFVNATKALRLVLQIGILGCGAWLVLQGQLTGGGMIAASIIMSRALSPVERALGAWRGFVSARTAMANLKTLFGDRAVLTPALRLPAPAGHLAVERLTYRLEGAPEPMLAGIDLVLEPGEACGIIGPSGSGKSSLCRLLVGAWQPSSGHVRLDGADVASWDPDELGLHIGYLPQEIVLFPGTIAENIARMGERDDAGVIAAARAADVHDMVLRLPKGYDTPVGPGGIRLSGGQKQRIGLARALFGDPPLVVLDEPNASLDTAGEQALQTALQGLRERRRTVVVVAHQANVLRSMDKILVLKDGRVAAFGERDKILQSLIRRAQPAIQAQSAQAQPAQAKLQQPPAGGPLLGAEA
jgi:ATP-binding cassette, subfamily C, bacterial exporter for protease/lipase